MLTRHPLSLDWSGGCCEERQGYRSTDRLLSRLPLDGILWHIRLGTYVYRVYSGIYSRLGTYVPTNSYAHIMEAGIKRKYQ